MPDKKVFFSSTCYDLMDARAELFELTREMNLTAKFSDIPQSDFEFQGGGDSIQRCLDQVAESDVVVLLLSQRYGPRLGRCGYADVSATHLEYKKAVELGKDVRVLVRDRLFTEYGLWKANPDNRGALKFNWLNSEKDRGLFDLLHEHEALTKGKENWVHQFSTAVDLKRTVRRLLADVSTTAILETMIRSGRAPLVALDFHSIEHGPSMGLVQGPGLRVMVHLTIKNVGGGPAIAVALAPRAVLEPAPTLKKAWYVGSLGVGEEKDMRIHVTPQLERPNGWVYELTAVYHTADAHTVADAYEVRNNGIFFKGKYYVGSEAFPIGRNLFEPRPEEAEADASGIQVTSGAAPDTTDSVQGATGNQGTTNTQA